MASIKYRGKNRDLIYVRVALPGGERVDVPTGLVRGQEEVARELLGDTEAKVKKAHEPSVLASSASPLTFKEWATKWTQQRKALGKMTWKDEESRLRLWAFPSFGDAPLASLTKAAMLDWVQALPSKKTDDGELLSSRYVHHIASTVKQVMGEAARRDLIVVNPCVWTKAHLPPIEDRDPERRLSGIELSMTRRTDPPRGRAS